MKNYFLFSIDLEDIRFRMDGGLRYAERVPLMIEKYLDFLDRHQAKITFFVVGDTAKAYPMLIRKIAEKGHEIACHSNRHIPISNQNEKLFKEDLNENIESLQDAGAGKVIGYRAPVFSLTKNTQWTYDILAEAGIQYSSSVLPAKNPLYGWNEFGTSPKRMTNGVWELPVTLCNTNIMNFPMAGGVYFRVLPFFLIRKLFMKKGKQGQTILGYFHPYDIDTGQEHFMHPGINDSRFYNFLMYYNRGKVFQRLEKLLKFNFEMIPYCEYLKNFLIKDQ